MDIPDSIKKKINDVYSALILKINTLIETHNTSDSAHTDLFNSKANVDHSSTQTTYGIGSSTKYGHTKAGGNPQPIGKTLSAGTDNGIYARANHVHTVAYSNISGTPDIPEGSSEATDIQMDGTRAAGSSEKFARANHVHPTDTSRAAASHTHIKNEITDFSHTHGNLQNDGKVGTSDNASKNVVTDANGKITTESKYSHPTYTARTGKPTENQTPSFGGTVTVSQITSNETGHVTGAADKTITIPSTTASSSSNGLMTSTDKSKLDGITEGANKYVHPSYTARTGKPTGNQTPAFGGTATVSQITSDASGHVTNSTDRTIKIPDTVASTSSNGLMSSTDKTKLDGISTGATKVSYTQTGTGTIEIGKINIDDNEIVIKQRDNNTTYTAASASPKMDGTATVGTSAKYAREDHIHPTDTSRASTDVTDDLQTQINNITTGVTPTDHNHDSQYIKTGTGTVTSTHIQDGTIVNADISSNAAIAQSKINNLTNDLTAKNVTLTKLTTATNGYIATYEIKQGTTSLGKIDIPKDYLVKSGSVKSVTTANSPVSGYAVGDKYIDFVINTKDNSGADEHVYINVKDLIDTYTAGTGLSLSSNAFSVKYGTAAGTACQGNDSRLSNTRTPTDGTVTTAKIVDGNVTTAKLADSSITSAKISDGTIVNGDIANTTIQGGKLVNGTITATQLASNAVETAKIKDANVTTAKIADANVTTAKIADSAITSAKIADGTIANGDIANTTIQGGKLVNGTITATQLASNSVETAKIKDANVTTAKIADNSITNAKLAPQYNEFHTYSAGNGTAGYYKLLRIEIGASYADNSINFSVNHRNYPKTNISINFSYYKKDSSSSDFYYKVDKFYYDGYPIGAYLVQTGDAIGKGTFEFYVYRSSWNDMSVSNIDTAWRVRNTLTVTKLSELVTSLPTGYITATINPYYKDTNTTYSTATQSANGLMSSTDKTKLDGIATSANNYSHPNSGVTAGTNYNGNQTPTFGGAFNIPKLTYNAQGHITASANSTVTIPNAVATTSAAGLMSKDDKSKLDGITASADAVSFTQAKTSGIEIGTITINGTATKLYQQDNNTTYNAATSSANGLLTSTDFNAIANLKAGKTYVTDIVDGSTSTTVSPYTDFNDYKTPGLYSNNSNARTNKMSNTPWGSQPTNGQAFSLIVLKHAGVRQLVMPYNTNDPNIYIRNFYNGSWGSWYKVYTNNNLGNATTSATGLMSSTDKTKLDGIETGANAYTHPSYTARTGVPTANATLSHGGTFTVSQPVTDATGHVTALNTRTYTLPSDNNTTYTAGDGIKLDGTTFKHNSGTGTAQTTQSVYSIKFDKFGHINAATAVSSMTPTSHTHGNITNDGKLGSASDFVVTDSSKNITTSNRIGNIDINGKIMHTVLGVATAQKNDILITDSNGVIDAVDKLGNITYEGKIGTAANKPIITGSNGVLQAGSFGTAANTFCQGNDSRLSDARTPTSHTHGNITNAGAIGSTANLPIITTTSGKLTTGAFESTATNIKMNGTQSVGSSNNFARADHVHPTDTSRAAADHTHSWRKIGEWGTSNSSSQYYQLMYINEDVNIIWLYLETPNMSISNSSWTDVGTLQCGTDYRPRQTLYTRCILDVDLRISGGNALQAVRYSGQSTVKMTANFFYPKLW